MVKPSTTTYENNPLLIATKGLELLFAKAISVAVLFLVLIGLSFLANLPSVFMPAESNPSETDMQNISGSLQSVDPAVWIMIGVIVLVAVLISLFIHIILSGISDYTASQLSKNKTTTLGEALGVVFSHFWSYSWVIILVGIKIFLWSLLFIIPGIIMSVRYSLSGVSYFDKQLKGNNAINYSLGLTKNAWLTTFAGQSLLPILTLGALGGLTAPGTNAVLYRQYTAANGPRPPAHIVSWLTLIIPIVLALVALFFVVGVALLVVSLRATSYVHG